MQELPPTRPWWCLDDEVTLMSSARSWSSWLARLGNPAVAAAALLVKGEVLAPLGISPDLGERLKLVLSGGPRGACS